ncbi:MAG: CAP domain-containing protein [Candidatus Nitrosopolaris sp.]
MLIGMAWGLRGRYSPAGNIVARRFSRDVECLRYRIYRHTDILTYLYRYVYMHPGMIKGTLNRTTNLFVLLIVISFILPATAIRYAQAATENSQESGSTGNGQESGSSTGNEQQQSSSTTENSQQSNNTGNEQQQSNNTGNATSTGVPENATSPSGSMENTTSGMESNNTANARQESNSTGNTTSTGVPENTTSTGVPENTTSTGVPENATSPSGSTASNNTGNMSADLANGILTLMNRERAAVGVQPLVWNDTAAAHAKAWAEYLAAGKTGALGVTHCIYVPGWEQIESCTHHEGENLVWYAPHDANRSAADYLNFWLSEKKDYHGGPPTSTPVTGHYTQIVWNTTKSVGCGIAVMSFGPKGDIMSCRFYPAGNYPRPPY